MYFFLYKIELGLIAFRFSILYTNVYYLFVLNIVYFLKMLDIIVSANSILYQKSDYKSGACKYYAVYLEVYLALVTYISLRYKLYIFMGPEMLKCF